MNWIFKNLFGSSWAAVATAIGLVVLIGGGIFAYQRYVVMPDINARLQKATEDKAAFEQANKILVESVTSIKDDLNEIVTDLKTNVTIIKTYAHSIAQQEQAIRSERQARDDRESNGDAEGVLSDDQKQINCRNNHFGDPTGYCEKGVWITYPIPQAKP